MRIAFPTNNERTIANHIGLAKKFLVIDTKTREKFLITNPIIEIINQEHINLKDLREGNRGLGVGRVIPVLFDEAGVDIFVAPEFGEGMRINLEKYGIVPVKTDIKEIDEFLNQFNENKIEAEIGHYPRDYGFGYGRRFGYGRGIGFGRGFGYGRGFGRRRLRD
ncbi:NifB/NifX family molybdenum-iron cluster-binding protein [Caminibacter sp.]